MAQLVWNRLDGTSACGDDDNDEGGGGGGGGDDGDAFGRLVTTATTIFETAIAIAEPAS